MVERSKEGKGCAQMASAFEVARKTSENWAEEEGEFLEALTRARTEAKNWWENKGMESLGEKNCQSSVWAKSMQARFRDDYTERRDHVVHGDIRLVVSEDDSKL